MHQIQREDGHRAGLESHAGVRVNPDGSVAMEDQAQSSLISTDVQVRLTVR